MPDLWNPMWSEMFLYEGVLHLLSSDKGSISSSWVILFTHIDLGWQLDCLDKYSRTYPCMSIWFVICIKSLRGWIIWNFLGDHLAYSHFMFLEFIGLPIVCTLCMEGWGDIRKKKGFVDWFTVRTHFIFQVVVHVKLNAWENVWQKSKEQSRVKEASNSWKCCEG